MKAGLALATAATVASVIAPAAAWPWGPSKLRDCTYEANPYKGKTVQLAPDYVDQTKAASIQFLRERKRDLAAKALKVGQVPVFYWIDRRDRVKSIGGLLREARKDQLLTRKDQVVQIVVYNLPDRDCSAKASAGELIIAEDGEAKYKAYIQDIYNQLKGFPEIQVVLVLEPDSLGNVVTNMSVPKCAGAAPVYKRGISYAIATFSKLRNVAMYVDAAHAAWLGWPGNITPTADLLAEVLAGAQAINPKANVRGFVSNVSNYNGLGNQPQMGYDELTYQKNLAVLLTERGFPAHSIVDQGRSGNQNFTRSGGDWCNNKNAGFGPRPTTNTPDPNLDAIVWVKPGGQADGTSDTTAVRYDEACGSETSLKPAPEAGSWFQTYFEQLILKADPPF